ncbi:unnamed protein product [Adineta steineri]|uniref:Lantibiotic biosynthesis protein dehydration domain-containing protein n=4 Tax=Adineta steineri TaxID=433720 RepID=A0A814EM79_9BILA|nr:unnamed protein product [Adineta steineri]CAF3613704.1 unnamed protein product [Adineta steineri]
MNSVCNGILQGIKYRDMFRAQYYISDLQNIAQQLISQVEELGCINTTGVLFDVMQHLADELDDMILPIVAYEIHVHKCENNTLTPHERYRNFFVDSSKHSWTNVAREVLQKYPFIFTRITTFCLSTVENIKTCLNRLVKDRNDISNTLSVDANPVNLLEIHVSGSDRHQEGQTVIVLTFQDKQKIVYKNCDSFIDQALHVFINLLDLSYPYDIKTRKFIKKNNYSWYEYIEHKSCNSMSEMKNYYKRSGSMLAVLDTLNYCDGHCENLIAHEEYPYLIDSETLFQNFPLDELEVQIGSLKQERSISFTGLIEKSDHIKKCDRSESCSAFQAAGYIKKIFQPRIINDHTDDIKVRFIRNENDIMTDESSTQPIYTILQNAPCLDKQAYTIESFLDESIEGYMHTYQHIKNHAAVLLDGDNEFWCAIKKITSAREVIRTTLFYAMLIRRLQQPQFSANQEVARQYLEGYLQLHSSNLNSQLAECEINELLQLNIPYFTHQPSCKDLFMGDNGKCANYFKYSAMEQIHWNIEHASDIYCNRQIAILRNVINSNPIITSHCPCYNCLDD